MALKEIDPQSLARHLAEEEVLLIDVREPGEHAGERIPGARLHPMSGADLERLRELDGWVVLHCQSGNRSRQVAEQLIAAGVGEVTHLRGGLAAWKAAGQPVERDASAPIGLDRQVRIVAGTLIVLGVALGVLWSPWALALSAAMGAGLIFTGVTNSCAMALLLARLPYNRRAGGNP